MNLNATNQIAAGEVLFDEGKPDKNLYMVLKGKVLLANRGAGVVCAEALGKDTAKGGVWDETDTPKTPKISAAILKISGAAKNTQYAFLACYRIISSSFWTNVAFFHNTDF